MGFLERFSLRFLEEFLPGFLPGFLPESFQGSIFPQNTSGIIHGFLLNCAVILVAFFQGLSPRCSHRDSSLDFLKNCFRDSFIDFSRDFITGFSKAYIRDLSGIFFWYSFQDMARFLYGFLVGFLL